MRRENHEIGATAAIAVISLIAATLHLRAPITTVVGIALVASLGYIWAKVLLGRSVTGLERVVVAVGLTIVVPILGGLVLQAAGVLLNGSAWVGLFAVVTLLGDVALVFKSRVRSQYQVESFNSATAQSNDRHLSPWRAVVYSLAVIIAAGAVGLAVVGAVTQAYPGFTELWLTTRGSNTASASLGVSNHQGSTEHYRLVLFSDKHIKTSWDITLANGATWQREVSIQPQNSAVANLYLLPDSKHPYRHVQI